MRLCKCFHRLFLTICDLFKMANSDNNVIYSARKVSEVKDTANTAADTVNGVRNTAKVSEKLACQPTNEKRMKLKKLPLLINCSKEKLETLLLQKIRQCFIVFKDQGWTELKYIELKKSILHELIEFIADNNEIPTSVYPDVFEMFSINVFRDLPPPKDTAGVEFDLDDEDSQLNQSDPTWVHLQLVYEFFLRFIESPNFNVSFSKSFINQKFVVQLLDVFDSEDTNERELLKEVLHRVYGKFLSQRAFIRKRISYIFYTFVYETGRHSGIAELLEVLGSIINGFAVPLKPEHKTFFLTAIMPLHKPNSLICYHSQLLYCVTQYLRKDQTLAEPVVKSLLRFWPKSNSTKELIFLDEVQDILSIVDQEEHEKIAPPLKNKLSHCASNPHHQVKERALQIYNMEQVLYSLSEQAI